MFLKKIDNNFLPFFCSKLTFSSIRNYLLHWEKKVPVIIKTYFEETDSLKSNTLKGSENSYFHEIFS